MKKFVLRRFAQMIFVWILVSIFSFSIVYFAPGDPLYIYMTPGATGHKMTDEELDRMRESLGLNGNVVEQYMSWAGKAARGNLGISINNKRPVLDQILEKLPCTAGLMGASLVLSLVLAIPLGLIAGTHKNKLADNIISGLTYLGISVPAFWLGIMMIIVFSMTFKLLPGSGMRTIGVNSAWDVIQHGIMPALVLSLNNMAVYPFQYNRPVRRGIRPDSRIQGSGKKEDHVRPCAEKLHASRYHLGGLPSGDPGDRFLYH